MKLYHEQLVWYCLSFQSHCGPFWHTALLKHCQELCYALLELPMPRGHQFFIGRARTWTNVALPVTTKEPLNKRHQIL